MVEVISQGAAGSWQMVNRHKTMLDDHFTHGFAVDWMRKDLGICLETADEIGASLPVTALVDQFYKDVQTDGRRALGHLQPDQAVGAGVGGIALDSFGKRLDLLKFGANLPENVIAEFEEAIGPPQSVSSGDITNITKVTRHLVQKVWVANAEIEEEIYRLGPGHGITSAVCASGARRGKTSALRAVLILQGKPG